MVNAFNAVNAVIAAKWPTRYVYTDSLPKGFTRPSFFLQEDSSDWQAHTHNTVEWTVHLMLDCFVEVDNYNNQKHLELLSLQKEVLALFASEKLPAGDRSLQVKALSAGSSRGEAYVDITVSFVDDKPVEAVDYDNMSDIQINYRG